MKESIEDKITSKLTGDWPSDGRSSLPSSATGADARQLLAKNNEPGTEPAVYGGEADLAPTGAPIPAVTSKTVDVSTIPVESGDSCRNASLD